MLVQQTTLFDDVPYDRMMHDHVVNVASVPQLSPFRYPGGKTWLVPYIRRWLSPLIRQQNKLTPLYPAAFIEPFAGGGIISLTVAAENLANHITMVELDEDVAAVWQTIFHEDLWKWLAQAIVSFDLTDERIESFFSRTDLSLQEWALKTIIRNRVNRGDFLMTYDDTEEVRSLAQQHGFDTLTIAMKSTHHAKMQELLIGKDLNWLK